ncbi:MAG: lytic transglycosylase domain-containing protein [Acidobacteriota bacterium]|nr:lytic transglycosylase domain-containing protein [Acidobacteriota bacterium]
MSKLFLSLLLALPAWAGEYAVLANGFRIHAERHEAAGGSVRLYTKDGVTEVPAASVASFEAEEYIAPPVAPPRVDTPLPVRDTRTLVRDAAIRSGLPPTLVESVARVESALRPEAVSPKGALGVMQLMPATARMLDADPRDTAQNIDAGARLLRELLIKYDGDVVKALSAYNAGEGAVDRYRGMPPYPETQDYVDKVIRTYVSTGAK